MRTAIVRFSLVATALAYGAPSARAGEGPVKTFDWPALNRRAAEEYLAPVRPGVPGKSPFWNVAAKQFTYVPAFDIEEAPGAARYRIQATDLTTGKVYSAIQEKPWAPVVELWRSLPTAAVRLEAFALDDKDNVLKR